MRRLWRNYSLGIVYLAGWLITWALHAYFSWYCDTFFDHNEVTWWVQWLETSFENLASEYHQVGAFILLSKLYVFKGSPQSKDGDAEMKRELADIKALATAIARNGGGHAAAQVEALRLRAQQERQEE